MLINRVSRVMGDRRMSISELSRRAGIGRPTAHRLYHGSTDATLEVLGKVCDALGADLCELFEWVPDGEAGGEREHGHRATGAGV